MRIGDKWTAKILRCLEEGPRRFSELRVPLHDVTAKVLTETLRSMERDGLVTRAEYREVPLRVEYSLTDLGRSLFGPLEAQCEWTRAHREELTRARDTYERR
jgi:DNA-binding HxlR family transcriptional regulator